MPELRDLSYEINAVVLSLQVEPTNDNGDLGLSYHGVPATLRMNTSEKLPGDGVNYYHARIGEKKPECFVSAMQSTRPLFQPDINHYLRHHQKLVYTSLLLDEFKNELLRAPGTFSAAEQDLIRNLHVCS